MRGNAGGYTRGGMFSFSVVAVSFNENAGLFSTPHGRV